MSVRSYRKMLSVLLAVIVVIGGGYCYREWRAEKAEREASVSELSGNLLIPGGMPVGIYMETDGKRWDRCESGEAAGEGGRLYCRS